MTTLALILSITTLLISLRIWGAYSYRRGYRDGVELTARLVNLSGQRLLAEHQRRMAGRAGRN